MSGILQRLAGQAIGAHANNAPGIRPAASVHVQVPVGMPREGESSPLISPLLPNTTPRSESLRNLSPDQAGYAKKSVTVVRSVETIRSPDTAPNPPRTIASRADSVTAPRKEPRRRDSGDILDSPPRPLLDEVEAVSQAPIIKPASQPPLLVSAVKSQAHDEPTEVYVHIGRIEVIAAPEPAPPKKNRVAPARNTLPLTEYLARRSQS